MRILGIDFGDKRIGLAVSDPLLITSQPLGVYEVKGRKQDIRYFRELAKEYSIAEIVIGLPLQMDGKEGERAEKTRKFGKWLEQQLKIPVIFWDERLSTREALQVLHRQEIGRKKIKKNKDRISASIILSSYLERKRGSNDYS